MKGITMRANLKKRFASQSNRAPAFEGLESRTLLSGGGGAPAPQVFAPDAKVKGESIAQWTAEFWTKALQAPVFAPDGSDLNPLIFDDAPSAQGNADGVFFLFGSLLGGHHDRTATVPTGTPILVPVLPIEFSNFDTPSGNVPYDPVLMNLPGDNTAKQLSDFAADAALPALEMGGELHMSVDGHKLANPGAYLEMAPTFSYVLPADSLSNFAFGQTNLTGLVSPAEADGFYVMLKPLSPGHYVINAGGKTLHGSLGPLSEDVTWTINVVPKGQFEHGGDGKAPNGDDARPPKADGHDASSAKEHDEDVLGRSGKNIL
jgi:hypothetical protein